MNKKQLIPSSLAKSNNHETIGGPGHRGASGGWLAATPVNAIAMAGVRPPESTIEIQLISLPLVPIVFDGSMQCVQLWSIWVVNINSLGINGYYPRKQCLPHGIDGGYKISTCYRPQKLGNARTGIFLSFYVSC